MSAVLKRILLSFKGNRRMANSDSAHSSDDSSGSDAPNQSSSVPNPLSLLDDDYVIDRDSLVDGILQTRLS